MHEVEAKIAAWRKTMSAALPRQEDTVRELEEHLREHLAVRLREGVRPDEALEQAIERVGNAKAIAGQFARVSGGWLPVSRPVLTVLAAVIVTLWVVLLLRYQAGKLDLLLVTHVLTITTGYYLVAGAGMVGVCAIVTAWFRPLAMREWSELQRVLFRLTVSGALFLPFGIGLGMFWAAEHLGAAWSWDKLELGSLVIVASTLLSLAAQTRLISDNRARALVTAFGVIAVVVGWFAAKSIMAVAPVAWLCVAVIASQVAVMELYRRRAGRIVS